MKRLFLNFLRKKNKPDAHVASVSWINVVDRLPPVGKLVYVKLESGRVTAYTYYGNVVHWNSRIDDSNEAIVAWFEQ
jgi:hypothetical protein